MAGWCLTAILSLIDPSSIEDIFRLSKIFSFDRSPGGTITEIRIEQIFPVVVFRDYVFVVIRLLGKHLALSTCAGKECGHSPGLSPETLGSPEIHLVKVSSAVMTEQAVDRN